MLDTHTHMYFLGNESLCNGFRLAGFDVYPEADGAVLDNLLKTLLAERQTAFVVLDDQLASSDSKLLNQVRAEGGRILVTEVPSLNNPDNWHSSVDQHIELLLNNQGNA